MDALRDHFEEYIGRYAVVASPFLIGLAALLGKVAADLGGLDTPAGKAAVAAASAVGTAATIATWLVGLGKWQAAEVVAEGPGVLTDELLDAEDPDAGVGGDPGDPPLRPLGS